MGYVYLFTAVFFGLVKGYLGKRISDKTPTAKNSVLTNLIRMFFCIVVGFVFVLFDGGIGALAVSNEVVLVALGAGVATSLFIVSWLLSVRCSAYMSVEAFIAFGVLVPIVLSAVFYGETVSASQVIGLVLLLLAVVAMSVYSNQIKRGFSLKSLLLLTLTGLSAGLTDFTQKIFVNASHGAGATAFNFYAYVFSAIVLGATFLLWRSGENDKLSAVTRDKKKIAFIAVMAICLFCNSFFKTLSAGLLDAVLLYPLCQGLALAFSLLMSTVLFKEKLKPVCIVGICVMFVGMLFINVISF